MLLNTYETYITEGKLWVSFADNNTAFLLDKNDFYQLYYYLNDLSKPIQLNLDKPIVMEIIYKGHFNRPFETFAYWVRCGFKEHILREHMVADFKQLKFFSENDSVIVKFAENEEEIIFTQNIIEKTFDKYTGDILSLEEVQSLVKKKNIICAYIGDSICGVIKFEIKNSLVFWGHFAISEEFRGKGVATKLMQSFFKLIATNSDTRFQMWVVDDNSKAKFIYERIGFNFDHKISQSMLKEK